MLARAHALHHVTRNRRFGDVAIGRDFYRAQHGKVDMPAAKHREAMPLIVSSSNLGRSDIDWRTLARWSRRIRKSLDSATCVVERRQVALVARQCCKYLVAQDSLNRAVTWNMERCQLVRRWRLARVSTKRTIAEPAAAPGSAAVKKRGAIGKPLRTWARIASSDVIHPIARMAASTREGVTFAGTAS